MELVISPLERTLDVRPGANLLSVLLEHDIPISYSCRAGRCGTCRCKVLKGDVLESGHEFRTPPAGVQRMVLACQTALIQDCTIQIPEPDEVIIHPGRILKADITALDDLTHDVKRLRLRLAKPLSYSPGQYVQLQFTPTLIRPYSMAGLESDAELEFHIRIVPNGRMTQHVARSARVGDTVRVTGPLGTAYLRRKHQGALVCVAGSTGLAPILSIVRGALARGMANPIHLYFGVRTPSDLYDVERLREIAATRSNVQVNVVVATGTDERAIRCGLVTEALAQDGVSLLDARAYVCGPPAMVEATTRLLTQRGLPAEHVYADAFFPTGT